MMKKVSELTGIELDAWVLRARNPSRWKRNDGWAENYVKRFQYHPSSDWNIGGMIIESAGITITVRPYSDGPTMRVGWEAFISPYGLIKGSGFEDAKRFHAESPLRAAMRAYVASVYGEYVNV